MEPFLVSTERSYFLDLLTEEEKLWFTKNERCALTPYGINMNASYEPSNTEWDGLRIPGLVYKAPGSIRNEGEGFKISRQARKLYVYCLDQVPCITKSPAKVLDKHTPPVWPVRGTYCRYVGRKQWRRGGKFWKHTWLFRVWLYLFHVPVSTLQVKAVQDDKDMSALDTEDTTYW